MLYAIHHAYIEGYSGNQQSIITLRSSIKEVEEAQLDFCFSDGHPLIDYSQFYDDIKLLASVDWSFMAETYWADTEADSDRKRRRQAEFLVNSFFPWTLVNAVGVANEGMLQIVTEKLSHCEHKPKLARVAAWYY